MCLWRFLKKIMDPRNFVYTSDYPTTSIVWKAEVFVSRNDRSAKIPHNLPFTPLIMGVWSTNSNFVPAYDIADEYGDFDPVNGYTMLNRCDADEETVNLNIQNNGSANNDVYFRLFAYAPPDYNGYVPAVDDATRFIINTDYIVPKVVKEGVITHDSYNMEAVDVYHNLGYIPQARTWSVGPNWVGAVGQCTEPTRSQFWWNGVNDDGAEIDSEKLRLHVSRPGKYYYHIYGDQADAYTQ